MSCLTPTLPLRMRQIGLARSFVFHARLIRTEHREPAQAMIAYLLRCAGEARRHAMRMPRA